MNDWNDYPDDLLDGTITYLTDNEPDPSGPIGECRYNCGNAEHVGDQKYVCLHSDHWNDHGMFDDEVMECQ